MPKWFLPAILTFLILTSAAGIVVGLIGQRQLEERRDLERIQGNELENPLDPAPPLDQVELAFPAFSALNQDAQPIDQTVLDGEVTLVTFIFTNCVLVCPQMTGIMAQLHTELEGSDIRQLSISVDPANDTPAALKGYAARFGVDTARWTFAHADQPTVDTLASALQFELADDPDPKNIITLADGSRMPNIVHPTKIFLVGPDGRVIGLYSYQWPGEIDTLRQRLRRIRG